jgi:AraC family transcriptional regulator of adaptative response/methylated-DNA-[protein]-cysteine methyltransferase
MQIDQIVYRKIKSPLGTMIAGATWSGCCLLEFEDRGGLDRIKARLQKRYRYQVTYGTNDFVDQLETELSSYFIGSLKTFSVHLDMKGTPFQMAVWEQLLHIPYGETRSYGEISRSVGKPKAVRAVGRANGENYLAIVVPCHRVIQSDGNLRGYGGGLWRKKKLLDLERQFEFETVSNTSISEKTGIVS